MPSRRYYIAIAPVEHINGKLAPVAVKCPNSAEGGTVDGFYYGYRRRSIPVSRFGIRTKCRSLDANPYTASEDENRTLFTASLHAVYEHKSIASDWAAMLVDFDKQRQYTTPIGFAVASCRSAGGVWPARWSPG